MRDVGVRVNGPENCDGCSGGNMISCKGSKSWDPTGDCVYTGGEGWGIVFAIISLVETPNALFH